MPLPDPTTNPYTNPVQRLSYRVGWAAAGVIAPLVLAVARRTKTERQILSILRRTTHKGA